MVGTPVDRADATVQDPASQDHAAPRWPPELLLAVALAVVVAVLGWVRRWVSDDGFIALRVARNLADGNGPVFNPGERIEAHTSALWVFLLGLTNWVTGIQLEWLAVLFGIAFTATGVFLAARAAQALAVREDSSGVVVPVGALVVVALPPVWDFASSGLENGMTFAWLGGAFYAIVRVYRERRWIRWAPGVAVLVGLGPLIRPDLSIFAAGFIAALLLTLAPLSRADAIRLLAAALALPLVYQVFRMGYYAALAPNPGLVKEAGLSYWSAGWTYLKDFVSTYLLWAPVILVLAWWGLEVRRRWHGGTRRAVLIGAIPIACGLVHALYVVKVGGDFMHARLLLPSLFGLMLPIAIPVSARGSFGTAVVLAVTTWAVLCAADFRTDYPTILGEDHIADERAFYSTLAGKEHPVTVEDYYNHGWYKVGAALSNRAERDRVLVLSFARQPGDRAPDLPLDPEVPERIAGYYSNVGIAGFRAGGDVRLIDVFGLADPVASRLRLEHRGRPGHEKFLHEAFAIARFAEEGTWKHYEEYRANPEIAAAEAAIRCGELAAVLRAVNDDLSFGLFVENIRTAITTYNLRFHGLPSKAAAELCA